MTENTAAIIAIELLAAAQGIEFHRPSCSSDILEEPRYEKDRSHSEDIAVVTQLVLLGEFMEYAQELLPSCQ